MIIARFNCPSCDTPIEAPADSIARGIKCPECETGFMPGKVETADEAVEPAPAINRADLLAEAKATREKNKERELCEERERKWMDYRNLIEEAGEAFGAGVVCLIACIIATIVGFANDMNAIAFAVASGALSMAIIFFFFCQCLHIRAGLEKLSIKD